MELKIGECYQYQNNDGTWIDPFRVKGYCIDQAAYIIFYEGSGMIQIPECFLVDRKVRHLPNYTNYGGTSEYIETKGSTYYPKLTTSDINLIYSDFTKGEEDMTTLYQIDEKTYGTKLAVNSKGEWVMEVKGTGDVVSVDPKSVEEVIPYSVDIRFLSGDTDYSYWYDKDKLKVDDLIMVNTPNCYPAFAVVTAVDTKSKKATKTLECKRVVTEDI